MKKTINNTCEWSLQLKIQWCKLVSCFMFQGREGAQGNAAILTLPRFKLVTGPWRLSLQSLWCQDLNVFRVHLLAESDLRVELILIQFLQYMIYVDTCNCMEDFYELLLALFSLGLGWGSFCIWAEGFRGAWCEGTAGAWFCTLVHCAMCGTVLCVVCTRCKVRAVLLVPCLDMLASCQVTAEDEFLFLGCDGIFELNSNQAERVQGKYMKQ